MKWNETKQDYCIRNEIAEGLREVTKCTKNMFILAYFYTGSFYSEGALEDVCEQNE